MVSRYDSLPHTDHQEPAMIVPLQRSFRGCQGTPVLRRVDTAIFTRRYFMSCLGCDFCHDSCCAYGADVDVENVGRIGAIADDLEGFTGTSRSQWFTGEFQ